MQKRFASLTTTSLVLWFLAESCCPGGFSCTKIVVLGGSNRAPVTGATIAIYPNNDLSNSPLPALEYATEPGAYDSRFQCSGISLVKITHPNYQPFQQTYRSPHDRSPSCNVDLDHVTYVLTPL